MRRVALLVVLLLSVVLNARAQLSISGRTELTTTDGDTTTVGITYSNWDTISRQLDISVALMEPSADSLSVTFIPKNWTLQTVPAGKGSHGVQPATWGSSFSLCATGHARTGGIVFPQGGGQSYLFYVTVNQRAGVRINLDHNIRLGTPDSIATLTLTNVRSDSQLCILSVESLAEGRFLLTQDTFLIAPHHAAVDTIHYSSAVAGLQNATVYCHSYSSAGDSLQAIAITGQKTLGIHSGSLTAVVTDSVEVSIDTFTTIAVQLRNNYSDTITVTSVSTAPHTNWFEWLHDSLASVGPDSNFTIHVQRYFDILKSYPPKPILNVQFGVGYRFNDGLTSDRTVSLPIRFKLFNAGYTSFFGSNHALLRTRSCALVGCRWRGYNLFRKLRSVLRDRGDRDVSRDGTSLLACI